MRRLIVSSAVAASLVLTASTFAALPSQKAKFNGVTNEHPINGYKATVTFTSPAGGRFLKNFVFQTLGCFGVGSFPVGVDPFIEMPWRVASIPVSTTGSYTLKASPTSTAPDAGKMVATISGSFTSASTITGKITFSQAQSGATCGPKTVKFTASTGNSDSLS